MNASLLLDAMLDVLRTNASPPVVGIRSAWSKLKSVAAAPPGTTLISPDGTTYTGIVVIERSRAVLLLGLRHDETMNAHSLPQVDHHDDWAAVDSEESIPSVVRRRRARSNPKP